MTILVVEDNVITLSDREIVPRQRKDTKLSKPKDGRTAISKMVDYQIDLEVIQDMALPDIDGLSLAQTLRDLPGRENVPIVAFSAFVDKLEEARATKDLFRAFVPKPIEPSKLVSLVKRLLPTPVTHLG